MPLRNTTKVMRASHRYEAVTSCAFDVPVTTYVLYTGKAKSPRSELTEGLNTYKVNIVQLKGRDADVLFAELEKKQQTADIEKKNLVSVILAPLMSGKMSMKERMLRGVELLRRNFGKVDQEEYMRLEAMLYALATKFLEDEDSKEVMEGLKMTKLGEMLMEAGMEKALTESILEILARFGDIPTDSQRRLIEAKDLELLKSWIKLAVDSGSFEEFQQKM